MTHIHIADTDQFWILCILEPQSVKVNHKYSSIHYPKKGTNLSYSEDHQKVK